MALLCDLGWLSLVDQWRNQQLCLFYMVLHGAPNNTDIIRHTGCTIRGYYPWKLSRVPASDRHSLLWKATVQTRTVWDPILSSLTRFLHLRVRYLPSPRQNVHPPTIHRLPHQRRPVATRGVTIHRYIDISYRECQRYTNFIAGAWIDTQDIPSGGKNRVITCP